MRLLRISDDRGVQLQVPVPPRRIVSLVPSDTYSLVRLGAGASLVGRTRYCVAPADEVAAIPVVGGTKDADVEAILDLHPDLVIANQEESSRPDILALEKRGARVLVSFPQTVAAGLAHLARLARLLGFARGEEPARSVIAGAYEAQRRAEEARRGRTPVRAFVPIWMDPLMTVHGSTFISNVLSLVGAENVFADRERRYPLAADLGNGRPLPADRVAGRDVRYPRITLPEVVARDPELILLPDEPHPFTEADATTFRALWEGGEAGARRPVVAFCDGKDLMWYGARSVEGLDRLRALVDGAGRPESAELAR